MVEVSVSEEQMRYYTVRSYSWCFYLEAYSIMWSTCI